MLVSWSDHQRFVKEFGSNLKDYKNGSYWGCSRNTGKAESWGHFKNLEGYDRHLYVCDSSEATRKEDKHIWRQITYLASWKMCDFNRSNYLLSGILGDCFFLEINID